MIKKLNKDALESLLVRIPVIVFSFLHAIFLMRMLGPEGNGLYSFLMAGITLCMIVFGFDAQRSTLFHLASGDFDKTKIVGLSFKIYTFSILLVILFLTFIFFIRSPFSYLFIPEEHFILFYFFFFLTSFICQHLTTLFQTLLQAGKEFRSINIFLFLTNLLQVLLYGSGYLLTVKHADKFSFPSIFTLILCLQAITLVIVATLAIRRKRVGFSFKTKSVRRTYLQYSKLGYANHIGHFLNKRLDVWFVEFFAGLSSLGLYALASQLTNFLLLAAAPIEEVLKPYLISLDRKDGNLIFLRFFKVILYLIVLLSSLLFICSPWLIRWLFGTEFQGSLPALRILCLGIVFVNVKRIFLDYNRAYNDQHYNIWAQWTGVLLTVILGFVLIPKFGIKGAAWASVIAYGATALFLALVFMTTQKVSLKDILILNKAEWVAFKI